MVEHNHSVYIEQSNIIREMAGKSDCVIVGRCADFILRSKLPLRLFVYASMDFKITRCREKGVNSECLTDRELKQQILSSIQLSFLLIEGTSIFSLSNKSAENSSFAVSSIISSNAVSEITHIILLEQNKNSFGNILEKTHYHCNYQ